jgi:hypothetical protein
MANPCSIFVDEYLQYRIRGTHKKKVEATVHNILFSMKKIETFFPIKIKCAETCPPETKITK